MSDEQRDIVNALNAKIQQVVQIYEQTKAECDALKETVAECEAKIGRLTRTVNELEEKNKKLQLAGAFKASSEDTRDAKLKISKIVREIDKCMALLNK